MGSHHYVIGHILLGWGFWLSGIAVGYIAAKRDWRRATRDWALALVRSARAAENEALSRTLSGVDLGPWIEKCREPESGEG